MTRDTIRPKPHRRRLMAERSGASALEFALVAPLLLILMVGVVVLGQAAYAVASMQWAIEHSVRQFMISKTITGAELEALVRERLGPLGDIEMTIHYSEDEADVIPVARVTAAVSYPVALPLIPAFNLNYTIETHVPRPF